MKTIKEFIYDYFEKNKNTLIVNYPGLQAKRLLEDYCLFENAKPDDHFILENAMFFERIQKAVPLEYITNESFFYKSSFYVNEHVLIPRSETEILVEDSINHIRQTYHENYSIYEVGTGSGVIPLTIATEIDKALKITACDVSEEVLEIAFLNYNNLKSQIHADTKFRLENRDRLNGLTDKFDLIVSNPPYIKTQAHREGVHEQTHLYEPHLALYIDDENYDQWFANFFARAAECLTENGAFFMEGHEDVLNEQAKIAEKYFSKVIVKKDYTGSFRFLYCYM